MVRFEDTIRDFKRWCKENPNFVTPEFIKSKTRGLHFVELSAGVGLDANPIFGVSIRKHNPKTMTFDNIDGSTCFRSKDKAELHYRRS